MVVLSLVLSGQENDVDWSMDTVVDLRLVTEGTEKAVLMCIFGAHRRACAYDHNILSIIVEACCTHMVPRHNAGILKSTEYYPVSAEPTENRARIIHRGELMPNRLTFLGFMASIKKGSCYPELFHSKYEVLHNISGEEGI